MRFLSREWRWGKIGIVHLVKIYQNLHLSHLITILGTINLITLVCTSFCLKIINFTLLLEEVNSFGKCDQICRKLQIWSHLLKKSTPSKLMQSTLPLVNTAQKMKFSIKDFFSKWDQIRRCFENCNLQARR